MKIAICGLDDCEKQLCEKIERVCKRHYRTVQIQNAFEEDCDIVFAIGTIAAKEIRQKSKRIHIVLVCDSNEEALEGYDIRVNNCIKKPLSTERIEMAIFNDSG